MTGQMRLRTILEVVEVRTMDVESGAAIQNTYPKSATVNVLLAAAQPVAITTTTNSRRQQFFAEAFISMQWQIVLLGHTHRLVEPDARQAVIV